MDFGALQGSIQGSIDPLYIADGAAAIVLEESFADAVQCRAILVWTKDGGLRRHVISEDLNACRIGWWHQNRPSALADFVTTGRCIVRDTQVAWAPATGLQTLPYERMTA
jgi:hypothetical protein